MVKKASATPIKVSPEAHRQAKRLLEVVSLRGWSAIGISRTDPPTLMSLLDEAILLLARQVKEGGSS
jgi:hypothetical protein